MSTTAPADILPLSETIAAPADQSALAAAMADAFARATPMYPIGGGTSLDYGLRPSRSGIGISTSGIDRLVDYPAHDMTITVEAGMTMARLAEILAAERQWLPVDPPQPAAATIGGVVATAASGPRRYANGTLRDYVIGIRAVDGRGVPFNGGGRVVKNVAGYDFCKLLTGSLGTLGVISQVTLKIKPLPERTAFLVHDFADLAAAERLLAALVDSATTPAAIELLAGPHWQSLAPLPPLAGDCAGWLAVGLEGTADEVDWMLDQLAREWRALGADAAQRLVDDRAVALWDALREFPAAPQAPLVVKAALPAGRATEYARLVRQVDPTASLQVHAGNGILIARFARFEAADVSRQWIGRLQPAARVAGGSAVVLSSTLDGLTRQAVWGGREAANAWMDNVKRQFDPKDLLNPGRFVYEDL